MEKRPQPGPVESFPHSKAAPLIAARVERALLSRPRLALSGGHADVLAGVLDPERTIQIGIRGGAEYLWEFSHESGMTVIHAEEFAKLGQGDGWFGRIERSASAGGEDSAHRRNGAAGPDGDGGRDRLGHGGA